MSPTATATHPEVVAAVRALALASNKLKALQDEAIRLAPLVAGGTIVVADADELIDAAETHAIRREDAEHIMREGLAGRSAGIGYVPHGAQPKVNREPRRAASTVTLRCMAEITAEPVTWIWTGRLAAGKLTLLAGDPGAGKSHLTLDIAARISTAAPWPDAGNCRAPLGSVVILSAEDGHSDTLRPRLDAAGADVSRAHVLAAVTGGDGARRTFDLAADIEALARAVAAIGDVRLVIVDPITSYMGRIDGHRTTDVRRVLEPLSDFAERLRVAVLAISHPPKAAPTRALHAVTGSYAYVAAARMVFIAGAEPDTDRRLLLPIKSNLAALADGLAYRIGACTIADGAISTSRVVWDSAPVKMTADQLISVSAAGDAGKTPTDAYTDFLREILAGGPVAVATIEQEARAAGLLAEGEPLAGAKPFRRAREALDIRSSREGFGPGGRWLWALPSAIDSIDAQSPEGASIGIYGDTAQPREHDSDEGVY